MTYDPNKYFPGKYFPNAYFDTGAGTFDPNRLVGSIFGATAVAGSMLGAEEDAQPIVVNQGSNVHYLRFLQNDEEEVMALIASFLMAA